MIILAIESGNPNRHFLVRPHSSRPRCIYQLYRSGTAARIYSMTRRWLNSGNERKGEHTPVELMFSEALRAHVFLRGCLYYSADDPPGM